MNSCRFQPWLKKNQKDFKIPDIQWDSFVNLKNYLSRFAIWAGLMAFLFLGCIFGSRICLVSFITLSIWSGILFLYARAVALGLEVQRRAPTKIREGENLEIKYDIANSSQFAAPGFYIVDQFTGTRDGQAYFEEPESLLPLRRRRIRFEVLCNNGMGLHKLGPLILVVSDPLGIFNYVLENQDVHNVEVFPLVKEIPDIRLTGTKYSDSFGIYDQLNPGSSISFMGIRPYVAGDPVKYISWKLSAKVQELMVKIFDQSVADDVTIMVDLAPSSHLGIGPDSTWHMIKELALSLTRQCLDHGNRVQVASQNLYVPWGKGEDYWADMVMRVGMHTPEFLKEKSQKGNNLDDYLDLLPRGSTVFFASTFLVSFPDANIELIEKIRARSIDVYVFMVDTLGFIRGTYPLQMFSLFAANSGNRNKNLEVAKIRLITMGVPTYMLAKGQDMRLAILKGSLR